LPEGIFHPEYPLFEFRGSHRAEKLSGKLKGWGLSVSYYTVGRLLNE